MRVSVVIPVKNDAALLLRCLDALASQTVATAEVVVVDNGSTDDSARVAALYGAVIIDHPTGTIPAAAAAGLDAATGDILARLDADCVPPRDWVERIIAAMGDSDAITGGADFIDGPRWLRRPLAALYLGAYYASLFPALGHVPLFGSNFAITHRAWVSVSNEVHRDDDMVHDDLDLSFHLGRRHGIHFARSVAMGMSMRPFADAGAFVTRVRRGFHTVIIHWPHDLPWLRWVRRGRKR